MVQSKKKPAKQRKSTPKPRKRGKPGPKRKPGQHKAKANNPTPPTPRTVCDEQMVAAAIHLHKGLLYLVAQELGVTPSTLRNYFDRWPNLRTAVKVAKGHRLDMAEKHLDTAINRGDVKAICYYLDRQGKKRGYVPRTETRIGGDAKAPPVNVATQAHIDSLPLELRKQILAAIEAKQNSPTEESEREQSQETPASKNGNPSSEHEP